MFRCSKWSQEYCKTTKVGIRAGGVIVCNRQLLVSNAFEQWLEEHFPEVHAVIRKNYDIVGDTIHRHHNLFENKYICDLVYLLMKPAEWLFVLTLYLLDREPESRIARQYFHKTSENLGNMVPN